MNKNTLEKLIKAYSGDDLAGFVVTTIEEETQLLREINNIRQEQIVARKNFEKITKDLDCKLREIQSKCPHYETAFFPDASGGNDSITECNLCGKEL